MSAALDNPEMAKYGITAQRLPSGKINIAIQKGLSQNQSRKFYEDVADIAKRFSSVYVPEMRSRMTKLDIYKNGGEDKNIIRVTTFSNQDSFGTRGNTAFLSEETPLALEIVDTAIAYAAAVNPNFRSKIINLLIEKRVIEESRISRYSTYTSGEYDEFVKLKVGQVVNDWTPRKNKKVLRDCCADC
jgi:hypothetical protein